MFTNDFQNYLLRLIQSGSIEERRNVIVQIFDKYDIPDIKTSSNYDCTSNPPGVLSKLKAFSSITITYVCGSIRTVNY